MLTLLVLHNVIMIFPTKGILLHRFKYSDSKIILKIFTREFGLQSYLFFLSVSAKNKSKLNLLQPMYLLDLQVYYKNEDKLQKIKEISPATIFTSIPFDIYKQTMSLFFAEFLLKILQENEKDIELFDFVFHSLIRLDQTKGNINNFHLLFLIRMTKFLGIMPENNYSLSRKIFDLQAAKFIIGNPNHNDYLNEELSKNIFKLINIQDLNRNNFNISNFKRRELLKHIIKFYNIHLDRPGKLKSPEILAQIFS